MFVAKGDNAFDCCIQILEYERRRYAQHSKPARLQIGIAAQIALGPVAHIMRLAVNFDSHAPLKASEIQHQFAKRMVAAEFEPAGPFAQFTPDQSLWQVARAALAFRHFESLV